MPIEIELKLALPASCCTKPIQELVWLEPLNITATSTQKLYSIYYDTPDLKLKQMGCSLRLRRIGKDWVQTIKAGGSIAAGLHQHDEWETPLVAAYPDFSAIQHPRIKQLFRNPQLRATLQPVFTTKFTRHLRHLHLEDGTEIEICLDHGKIIAGNRQMPICEIELELKSGEPIKLLQLSRNIVDRAPFPLRLENASKAERGYILFSRQPPPPFKAIKTEIKPEMHLHQALRMIMQNCLIQVGRNENGMLMADADVEYLHQMRVALRRFRSALNTFSQTVSGDEVTAIRKELKWLFRQLNPARDWDILVTETLPDIISHFPDQAGLPLIRQHCQKLRQQYNTAARKRISSRRYTRLMLDILIWLNKIGQHESLDSLVGSDQVLPPGDIKTFATTSMAATHQEIMQTGEKLKGLDTPALHALRIAIKKQRYIADFFMALYPQTSCKRYIALLATLQNDLGAINDYAGTQKFLDELDIRQNKRVQYEAIGIIRGWSISCMLEKKKALDQSWNAFRKAKPFWGTVN
ncbi:CHAD domain-containing protein [Nitrosomonas sp. ANs5]|uniref:CYTH and CHAD domain-containing protein n=1 Tax=Nitrosomonas sp. ANs5 TaxID=3423941 RepID=UPI003D348204